MTIKKSVAVKSVKNAIAYAQGDSESIKKFVLAQDWGVPKKQVRQWLEWIENLEMSPKSLPVKQAFPDKKETKHSPAIDQSELREKILEAAKQLQQNFKHELRGRFYLSQR